MPDTHCQKPRFNVQVILGFLLGVVASLLCLFFAMFVASTLNARHARMHPIFTGIALFTFGLLSFRSARSSRLALGAAVAFGLALLLDAAFALTIFR
jgi:hypothetical protein